MAYLSCLPEYMVLRKHSWFADHVYGPDYPQVEVVSCDNKHGQKVDYDVQDVAGSDLAGLCVLDIRRV